MTVRPATPDDAYPVAVLHVRAWRWAYAGIMPDETLAALDADARAERRRGQFADQSVFETLVAVDGAGIRGFASFGPYRMARDRADVDGRYAEVYAIYVDPDHVGTGAGRALMDAARARLAERDFVEVRLWVLEANLRARRFYERYGFTLDTGPDGRALLAVERPGSGPVDLAELRYRAPARTDG